PPSRHRRRERLDRLSGRRALGLPPPHPISRNQLLTLTPPPSARRVRRHLVGWIAIPVADERIDYLPRRFNLVTAREERCFADHDVEQERLVCGRRSLAEDFIIREIHVDRRDFDL